MSLPTAPLAPEQLRVTLDGPAGMPPFGILPQFDNPPNLNAWLILTLTLCWTFGTVALLMRVYTKLFIIKTFACEDCKFASWARVFLLLIL